jgi:hypothetical protein
MTSYTEIALDKFNASETEHQIAVIVKWHGPTNYRGARISLTLPRWDNKRVFLSFDHSARSAVDQAQTWLNSKGAEAATLFDLGNAGGYMLGISWKHVDNVLAAFNVQK